MGYLRKKLTTQPCKIAYLGGSATAQKDGYRWFLHQWFRKSFHQEHLEINAGNGGITSSAAVFTMDENVISQKPDLCFIEYCTTDMDKNHEIGAAVEGMVRKLKAINCQVCFLYLYKTDRNFDYTNQTIIEYDKVADFYNIPSINVGKYIEEGSESGQFNISELFSSKERTVEQGSQITSDFIAQSLEQIFTETEANKLEVDLFDSNDKSLYDNHYGNGRIVNIDPSLIRDRDRYKIGKFKQYQYHQLDFANEVEFTIKGDLVGLATIVGPESGIIELVTPEKTWEYKLWDSYCFQDRFQVKVIDRNFAEPTVVKLRLTEKPVDYSNCRQPLENTDSIVKNFKLVGLLVCGTIG